MQITSGNAVLVIDGCGVLDLQAHTLQTSAGAGLIIIFTGSASECTGNTLNGGPGAIAGYPYTCGSSSYSIPLSATACFPAP